MQPIVEVLSAESTNLPARRMTKEKDVTKGNSLQLRAWEYYLRLENRTYESVAEYFGIPLTRVRRWAFDFKWSERLKDYLNKSIEERTIEKTYAAVERQVDLVRMMHSKMTGPDPENPGVTGPTDKLTLYGLKETGTVLLNAVKTIAEMKGIKKSDEESGPYNGKGMPKTGVMVNVIFKGISENG